MPEKLKPDGDESKKDQGALWLTVPLGVLQYGSLAVNKWARGLQTNGPIGHEGAEVVNAFVVSSQLNLIGRVGFAVITTVLVVVSCARSDESRTWRQWLDWLVYGPDPRWKKVQDPRQAKRRVLKLHVGRAVLRGTALLMLSAVTAWTATRAGASNGFMTTIFAIGHILVFAEVRLFVRDDVGIREIIQTTEYVFVAFIGLVVGAIPLFTSGAPLWPAFVVVLAAGFYAWGLYLQRLLKYAKVPERGSAFVFAWGCVALYLVMLAGALIVGLFFGVSYPEYEPINPAALLGIADIVPLPSSTWWLTVGVAVLGWANYTTQQRVSNSEANPTAALLFSQLVLSGMAFGVDILLGIALRVFEATAAVVFAIVGVGQWRLTVSVEKEKKRNQKRKGFPSG